MIFVRILFIGFGCKTTVCAGQKKPNVPHTGNFTPEPAFLAPEPERSFFGDKPAKKKLPGLYRIASGCFSITALILLSNSTSIN